jgi:hypothetical protein
MILLLARGPGTKEWVAMDKVSRLGKSDVGISAQAITGRID